MTEIEALKTIDEVLSALAENAARDRVLRWACGKYMVAAPMASASHTQAAAGKTPQRARKSKNKSRPKASSASSPSIVTDLNLKPKGKSSLDQLVAQKLPKSNQHKCVVAVYYLKHEINVPSIAVDHVYTCFKHMKWRVPSSLANTMAYVASVHGWLDTRNMADIKMTTIGENLVEHDLPSSTREAGTQ
jgi:hypothetical protein